MSGLTAWHSPLPDAKPRLELYVWSLIEDARGRRMCAHADDRAMATGAMVRASASVPMRGT